MAASKMIELDPEGFANLKEFAGSRRRFLVTQQADGTLILRPVDDLSDDELALRVDSNLMEQIRLSRADTSRNRKGRPRGAK